LVRGADGRASWQIGVAAAPAPASSSDASDSSQFGLLPLGTLVLRQALIVVDDVPLSTQLRVVLQGGEGAAMTELEKVGYQASVKGRWQKLPLELQIRSGGAMPLVLDAESAVAQVLVPLRVEGRAGAAQILFDGQAGALLGEGRLDGALRLRGPSLAQVAEPFGVTLPQTPPFEVAGRLRHAAGVWQLTADRAAIGRSLLHGDFRFDTTVNPPMLQGRLSGPRLALADLGPSVGTTGNGAIAAARPARVLPQRELDLPSLRVMNADVQVAIDLLDLGSTAVAPLEQLKTRLLLSQGVLQLQGLQAVVAGGRFGGSTRLDARGAPARWAVDLRFDGIDVAGWLRGLQPASQRAAGQPPAPRQTAALARRREQARQGGDQPVQSYLTGKLSGSVSAEGTGRSTAEILATLNGRAQLMLREGTLSHLITEAAGLDVAQALGVLIRGDQPLPLRCARLDADLKKGVLQPRIALIDNADSTLRMSGRIDLRDETLALEVTTRPKDMSPLSLRTPITVGGTLGAPTLGINGKQLAGKVLGSVALGTLVAPLAALLPLFDRGNSEQGDPCAEAPKATPAPEAKSVPKPAPAGSALSGQRATR